MSFLDTELTESAYGYEIFADLGCKYSGSQRFYAISFTIGRFRHEMAKRLYNRFIEVKFDMYYNFTDNVDDLDAYGTALINHDKSMYQVIDKLRSYEKFKEHYNLLTYISNHLFYVSLFMETVVDFFIKDDNCMLYSDVFICHYCGCVYNKNVDLCDICQQSSFDRIDMI